VIYIPGEENLNAYAEKGYMFPFIARREKVHKLVFHGGTFFLGK